jgi:hypothetical protein
MKFIYLSLLLVGCAHTPDKEYIEVPVFSPVVCEDFGRIEGVKSLPVVFVNAKDDVGFEVLGLRGDMYANLSIIIKDTLRYIGAQDKAINYYEKCIVDHNARALTEEGSP